MWLLAGVSEHVCLESPLVTEGFIAHFALMWLFARMDKLVYIQTT